MKIPKRIKNYEDIKSLNDTESKDLIISLLGYISPPSIIQPEANDLMKRHCSLINYHLSDNKSKRKDGRL
jgi:hypothetical protein